MSDGFKFRIDRRLYSEFVTRCHEEGVSPDEAIEAWIKRAVRQEGSVLPRSEPAEEKARLLQMRRRES